MRMNGWLRWGIFFSIVWAIGAAIYQRSADVDAARNFAEFAYKVCTDTKALDHDPNLERCVRERTQHMETWMNGSWGNVAGVAFAPIPFGWLAAFILLHVGRAQAIGFRAVVPWGTLSRRTKVFVAFCVLSTLAAILFGVIGILNLLVDTRVPVALGSDASVIKTGPDLVTVEGTWARSDGPLGTQMAYPLQTSRIECNRQEQRCSEARALVSGNTLMSELIDYEVVNWSASAIVLKNEGMCVSEVLSIDLKTDAVSGAGHYINLDGDYCKKLASEKEQEWHYHLGSGFPVYWEQRKRARPFVLRVIQAMFGN